MTTPTRERTPVSTPGKVGETTIRPDGVPKIRGEFDYSSDLWMDGMLWGTTLRSPHPHAKVWSIDTSEAEAMPGVHAVLTHADVPGRKVYGMEIPDQPVLAWERVRYQGEAVAIVAADHPETARRAAEKVAVEYEVLEPVADAEEAISEGAPELHGHPHSFLRGSGERKAEVTGDESGGRRVEAGLDNLFVLKTTGSGWENFYRDRYTTLPDTDDRILATVVTASWSYGEKTRLDYDRLWRGVRARILATFTDHYSPSVQNTLYRIGKAVLEEFPEVERIHLSFPNKHHLLYDLERFGVENAGEIFHATSEPYGLIEGTVERAG